MKKERWQEIERIYHAALELDPLRQEKFLQQACGADLELRQEGHYSPGTRSSCGAPGVTSFNYDVTPDGQHFLMVKDLHQDVASNKIHVVVNWTQELARRMAQKN